MIRTLLADDEKWALYTLQHLVDWKGEGFDIVATATDGISSLELVKAHSPDVVFLDIHMPGMTGLEVMEHMRELGMDTAIIIISGYSEFEYARKAIRLDAYDYLLKQVDKDDLTDLLRRLNHDLTSARSELPAVMDARGQSEMEDVVQYIKEHITDPDLSLSQIAAQFFISTSQLSRHFRARKGLSVMECATQLRMERARALLKDGRPLSEVSSVCGYRDYFYFLKSFKKYHGVSPSQYIKVN